MTIIMTWYTFLNKNNFNFEKQLTKEDWEKLTKEFPYMTRQQVTKDWKNHLVQTYPSLLRYSQITYDEWTKEIADLEQRRQAGKEKILLSTRGTYTLEYQNKLVNFPPLRF